MPRAKSGGTGDGLNATAHRCRGDTAAAEVSRCNRHRHRPRYRPWDGSGQEIRDAGNTAAGGLFRSAGSNCHAERTV